MVDSPSDAEAQSAEELITRRLRHEPTAYLLGHREFYNIDLLVGVGALIPRPDTEALVEEALRIAARFLAPVTIADVGCGTGAIGLAIAANLPSAHIYATDLYPAALALARQNTERLGLAGRVDVLEGDLLAPLPGPVDMITSNLPYVESGEIPTLDPEIRLYEPREALDGGDDGLDLIRRFLLDVPRYLKPSGVLLMEMDPRQIARARAFAAQAVPGATIRVVQDLTRHDRVLVLEIAA
jgi:release factor glutamine methyltransferase